VQQMVALVAGLNQLTEVKREIKGDDPHPSPLS
jgi:hypothetical protein